MTSFLVRDLDDGVMQRLKERAKRNGRSVQQEIQQVLRDAARPTNDEVRGLFEAFDAEHGPLSLDSDVVRDIVRQERDSR
jgi:plasmid stability protein